MALATSVLGTVMLTSQAGSVITTVGTNIIVGTITTTTSSIISVVKYLATNNQPGINEIVTALNNIDLEFTISIIEQLVKEQEHKELSESIHQALTGLHKILELIHEELNTIKIAIENHNSKYFTNWRSFSWTGNLDSIKKYNEIFKHRYSILFELLKIYK